MKSKTFINEQNKTAWYIFYTCPRAEKVAYEILIGKGYEVYLPLFEENKVWKNKKKVCVKRPLFPSYIFVNTTLSEIYRIINFPKIYTFLRNGEKPAILPINEIIRIKEIINSNIQVDIRQTLIEGQKVLISSGPFTGFEGILTDIDNRKRISLNILPIGFSLTFSYDSFQIKII